MNTIKIPLRSYDKMEIITTNKIDLGSYNVYSSNESEEWFYPTYCFNNSRSKSISSIKKYNQGPTRETFGGISNSKFVFISGYNIEKNNVRKLYLEK